MKRLVVLMLAGCGRISFDPLQETATDGQTTDAFPDPDLLFHVSFDGGLADVARGHAIMCKGTCTSVAGRVGSNAVMLDGASCITLLDDVDLHPPAFTLAVWANIAVPGADADLVARPLDGTTDQTNSFEIYVQTDSNVVITANGALTKTLVNVSSWHHYAAVYDGTSLSTFVDGNPRGGSVAPATVYGSENYLIGCDHDFGNDDAFSTGMFDEVRFYGRALSQTDISALANP